MIKLNLKVEINSPQNSRRCTRTCTMYVHVQVDHRVISDFLFQIRKGNLNCGIVHGPFSPPIFFRNADKRRYYCFEARIGSFVSF